MKSESSNLPGSDSRLFLNRRQFLKRTSTSAVAIGVMPATLSAAANTAGSIKVGLIGSGGRGKWIANLFKKHGGYTFAAVADYFPERVQEAGNLLGVPESARFSGLTGYQRLLEQPLDAVVIESPPYFHPEHAAAAVSAGKHVYLAKPIAVDVPGCLTVDEAGKRATGKGLVFLVDFQTRANPHYQEAARMVRNGDLGKIVLVEAAYHCGPTWDHMDKLLREHPQDPEVKLKAWGVDRKLSGDVISEQNIHAIDVACWMLGANPIRATGMGGRKREFVGDCWDHFAVNFEFPGEVIVSFNAHQSGFGYDDILCRVHGLKGTADTHYFGDVTVRTQDFRASNRMDNLYTSGAAANIATFHECITKKEVRNPTVAESVRSNLTSILGRASCYKHGTVTWEDMMRDKERFMVDLRGLKV